MGEGAFGSVWKAQRYFDEQLYAIKQIRLEYESDLLQTIE